jgi:xylulokinase
MAVDLGTSFIKVGVYNEESECIAEAVEAVKDYRPSPNVFIQKGDELFASVIACLKKTTGELGDRAKDVEAMSFTGQMSGFMGVSRDWEDITTWSCSLDARYIPYAERQMSVLKRAFLETAGTNFPAMAPKFEWYKTEFPDENKKIAKYLMISGYVIGKLGKLPVDDAVIDRSYTAWTGLSDIRNDSWSDEICDAIKLDKKFLPRIVNSNYICGKLDTEMAREVGLKSGIPLVSGAGDKVAGCLGAAIVTPGEMVFEAGSYGEISCCVEEYRPDLEESRLDVLSAAIPKYFYATHFVAGSGITLDWFVNNFVRKDGEDLGRAFARIDEKSSLLSPGCDGVMAIGLLGGSSMPLDGAIRGLWIGHNWSHRVEHFYRALLESFTYDFALAMKSIDRLYPEYDLSAVNMIGGGAKSPLWMQMFADVTGKTFRSLNRKDVSMWGAAILAGNAIGLFKDMKEVAKKHVSPVSEYKPDAGLAGKYAKYMNLYREKVVELRPLYEQIQNVSK